MGILKLGFATQARNTVQMRSGTADLPLHGGRVPAWLSQRMAKLGRVIVCALVHEYGRDEFLRRLAHPFWFQSFGSVMGMDWHSSGITTSVMGALKKGLAPVQDELGIYICGGRGKHSRKTPDELMALGERKGLDGVELTRISKLVAKIDSAAVQDGFQLYLHSFIVTDDGTWSVVQQGMNTSRKEARRYHWLSSAVSSFVDDPHSAIDGPNQGQIVNLADFRAKKNREMQLRLIQQGPDAVIDCLQREVMPRLVMPAHHDVRASDIIPKRFRGALAAAAERGPKDFEDLLLTPGLGARTVQALALVAEVIHGHASRFADPARFSMAHGGKDGHPFPVPLKVYDQSIQVLRHAIEGAKLDNADRLAALKRLHEAALRLEDHARGVDPKEYIAAERKASRSYGGRTVFDDSPAGKTPAPIHPQTSFGGAWQRTESRPAAPMKRARKADADARSEDAQLSLFGLGAEVNRAAR
jgi:hypothetical protein